MTKNDLPILEGKTVKLRPPQLGDSQARFRLGSNPEIVRMYGGSHSDVRDMTAEAAQRWVEGLINHGCAWVIEVDSPIGHIRLDRVDPKDRRASLAIGIDDPTRLGQGLGSEAINLVLEYAFTSLKLHRLSLRVVAYNQRAIRAYEKCGFVVEGREREAALVNGAWHDDVMMGILDREYVRICSQK